MKLTEVALNKSHNFRIEWSICDDYFWDSEIIWNSAWPELSFCFQHTVLTLIPCLFLWLFTPLQFYYFRRSHRLPLPWTWKNVTKMILSCVLSLNSLSVFLYAVHERYNLSRTVAPVWYIYPLVLCISMLHTAFLIFLCRRKGLISSGVLFLTWFFFSIFGVMEFYSWIRAGQNNEKQYQENQFRSVAYMVFYPVLLLQLILSSFADRPAGYTKDGATAEEHVPLEEKKKQKQKHTEREQIILKYAPSILWNFVKLFKYQLIFTGFLQLVCTALLYANPLVLKSLIGFVEDPTRPLWQGVFLSVVMFVVAVIHTILMNQCQIRIYRVGMNMRTVLVSAIYKKIFIAMFLLWQILGPAVLTGIAVMILTMFPNYIIGKKMHKVQVDEIRKKEMSVVKKSAYLRSAIALFFHTGPVLVALVSFATYVLISKENVLTPQVVFVSLTLFELLKLPVAILPMVISAFVEAIVSLKRLRIYLAEDEIDTTAVSRQSKQYNSNEAALSIENGSFVWENSSSDSDDDTPLTTTLKDINLEIKNGQFVAVVGQVGCGKSSLFSAILGEMPKLAGTVRVSGSVSFADQQAWIRNCTVRENITFGKTMDEQFYNQVLDVCCLRPDLKIFPGGDNMEIGEKGINLSGGQKHRVSLARAVYQDKDIYLLDDPLSAVDSHVGKEIFQKVIGNNGLLKQKTRILVTHGIQYLKDVDLIIVMQDGEISQMGTYEELINSKGAFAQLLQEHVLEKSEEDETKTAEEVQKLPESDKTAIISGKGKDLIQEESLFKGKVGWRVYMTYLKAIGYLMVALTCCFMMFSQCCSAGTYFWLADWTSDEEAVIRNLTATRQYSTGFRLAVFAALCFAGGISVYLALIMTAAACCKASEQMHTVLLLNILRSPMSFFDVTPVGRILNRFGKDIFMLDGLIPDILRMWIFTCSSLIIKIATIAVATPTFLVVLIPLGVIYLLVLRFYISTSRQLKRIEAVSRSPIYSQFQETYQGAVSVRAYGLSEQFIKESESIVDRNVTTFFPTIVAQRWQAVRLEFVGNSIVLFAALFAVLFRGDISPGLVGLSVSYALTITPTLYMAVTLTSELESNVISVERIKEYSDTQTEAEWDSKSEMKPDPAWPMDGRMEFQNYSTKYRPDLDLVLDDVNMKISPQEKIGIVGRTGAGKTSITLALFRVIEAVFGIILIDNRNIAEIGLHDLRKKLTIIPQDPVLFSGSVRLNLDPFDIYDDEAIWRALELSSLKSFITSLPEKLGHKVTEGGGNLSVGQRQLVCLARALLRKTKILVLDEATAAIDFETDQLIQKTIRREFVDCTILTIAHRLNTILDSNKAALHVPLTHTLDVEGASDSGWTLGGFKAELFNRVVVLEKGRIVEFGPPQELIEDKNSYFHKMAKEAGIVSD